MPYTLIFSPRAVRQLQALERYIAQHGFPTRARNYIERIETRCKSICLAPFQGTIRSRLRPGLRSVGMENRVEIIFEVKGTTVRILTIVYAGRLPDRDLRR